MADNDSKSMLTALGFSAARVTEALQVCGGNVEAAANYLFSAPSSSNTGTSTQNISTSSTLTRTIRGPMSQYSVNQGRSACTCMALAAAQNFLADPKVELIDREFLQSMILQGVDYYQKASLDSEHLAADQVLPLFSGLQIKGSVKQGMLPVWSTLRECLPSHEGSWCACLITKPPETVLALMSSSTCILVDSHPRPQQFPGADEAYSRIHSSVDGLINEGLSVLFPPMDLGPDVDPIMGAMYNAYDVYVLVTNA